MIASTLSPVSGISTTRRRFAASTTLGAVALGAGLSTSGSGAGLARRQASPQATPASDPIQALAQQYMAENDLRAVIVRVAQGGEERSMFALGESMTGVPATTGMHFRNGAVAISLVATLMLILVDDGVFALDDTIDAWMPDLPDSEEVTLRMLANMTAGYRDYVQSPDLNDALMEDPFRDFTADELLEFSFSQPRLFEPGTNWEYAHTAYVILGQVMEAATGESVEALMQDRVLDPLGLANTRNWFTPDIPEPVLHAFSSERRGWFDIEPGQRFYEESSFWNPSWTITRGAIQTTNITDMAASMEAVGKGTLLSPESFAAQFDRSLVGFGEPIDGCASCRTLDEGQVYGLGVWMIGPWVIQNPLFSGYSGTAGYLADGDLSIAVVVTYGEGAFDEMGAYANGNVSTTIFQAIAGQLAGGANSLGR